MNKSCFLLQQFQDGTENQRQTQTRGGDNNLKPPSSTARPSFSKKHRLPKNTNCHCCDNCPSKHPCAFGGLRCALGRLEISWKWNIPAQTSWAFPLSGGFNPNKLPWTPVEALSRDLLPCSASWAAPKSSSSHKPNDSPHFYKHIHVCCQTHELLFSRLLQESNQ